METHNELTRALKALEADLGPAEIPSSALVHLGQENSSEALQRVFKALQALDGKLRVLKNNFDMYRVEGTQFSVFLNHLTRETHVVTRVGKLVLPQDMRVVMVGRF